MKLLVVVRVPEPATGFVVSKSWCKTAFRWLEGQQERMQQHNRQQLEVHNAACSNRKNNKKTRKQRLKDRKHSHSRISNSSNPVSIPPRPANLNSDITCEHDSCSNTHRFVQHVPAAVYWISRLGRFSKFSTRRAPPSTYLTRDWRRMSPVSRRGVSGTEAAGRSAGSGATRTKTTSPKSCCATLLYSHPRCSGTLYAQESDNDNCDHNKQWQVKAKIPSFAAQATSRISIHSWSRTPIMMMIESYRRKKCLFQKLTQKFRWTRIIAKLSRWRKVCAHLWSPRPAKGQLMVLHAFLLLSQSAPW